jgi:NADH-quinone oxidoreductase subunit N
MNATSLLATTLEALPYAPGEFVYLAPIATLGLFGLLVLVADLFLDRTQSKLPLALLTAMGCLLAALSSLGLWMGAEDHVVLAGTLVVSSFGASLALAALLGCAVVGFAVVHNGTPALARPQTAGAGAEPSVGHATLAHGELYGLMLFATAGMLAMVVSNDLVTMFVALETMSIAVYALTGVDRRRPRSAEGAMKYFVLGAFSSGFLLYGISLVYGATHTLQLDKIAAMHLSGGSATLALTGFVLMLIGLLFKVGAVPFHSWSPDAYEAAPSAVTGFMSVGVKVAAFGAALRVIVSLGESGAMTGMGGWLLWLVAALTVIVGNAGALTQRNPRRLLAYSSIAHSGYVLIGLVAVARCFDPGHPGYGDGQAGPVLLGAGRDAASGVLYYMLAYGVANLGAFAVLCHLERGGEDVDDIADLAGLGKTQPGVALAMTISMLSLAGIPGTAGFLGKLWVFRGGVGVGDIGLVILALMASALSLFYYLRVVVIMYMHEPGEQVYGLGEQPLGAVATAAARVAPDPRRWTTRLAIVGAAILTIALGIIPGQSLLNLVAGGAKSLL